MDPSLTEKFITTKDAGEFSGYSSDYLSRLVRSKKIIGKRIGRNWIIDKESLTRFLNAQGNYKIDRARALASVRAEEYRAHRSLLHRATKSLTAQISVPEQLSIVNNSLSSHAVAFAVALVVIASGVFAAQAATIPQFAHRVASLAHEAASGFDAAFGGIPASIASRIDAADSAMRSVSPKLQKANAIEFANSAATSLAKITDIDFSPLRMATDSTPDNRTIALMPTTLVEEPAITVADVQTVAPTLRSVSEIGLDTISFLISPSRMTSALKNTYIGIGKSAYDGINTAFVAYDSLIKHSGASALALAATTRDALVRMPDLISKVNLALGTSIIAVSHAAIQADTAAAYWAAATAPASARATASIIGTTGDAIARATAGAAQEAPVVIARALRSLSDTGPALAQAVFDVEYAAATRFVAITGSVTDSYASALNSLGEVGYESALGTRHTIQLAAALPATLHDAYLGALGKSARALGGLGTTGSAFDAAKHVPLLAAALSGLSLGEQAALATYETIRGVFDSVNRSLVAFFTTTPPLVLPNGVPKPRVITIATSTKPATPYNLQPTISTSYPTYTTVVQGISADVLSRSLASLRTEMFDTIAAQIRPVSNQVAQNATTIQYVNMIQDLSNLIVRNGDFRGGTLTNGVSVSATTGNFTNLTGATASLGTTAITGDLSVSGTITFPSIISALSSVSAPYFTATSSTATSTFAGSFAIDTNGFVYATSTKNVGIGVLSPAALLAIQNSTSTQPIFVAKNAAGTEVYRLTDAGFVGIGTTSPTYALSVEGSSSLGNQAIAGYFTATSSVARSIFSGSLAIGTSSPFGNGLLTVGTSSPLLHIDSTTGNIGIGTTSPSQFLSVAGNGYFTGGLGVGTSTTTPGDLRIAGNAYVGGSLTVVGNNTILGNSTSNTLTINSSITSSIVPNQNATYNLGSPSFYWSNAYVGTLTANNISAASTTIGGTQSNTFTINSDNATADTEDMSLVFFRGTVVPNAILAWNSAGSAKRFEFNQPLHIQNASASTTQSTFTIQGVAGQTADIFSAASSSGANLFNLTSAGRIGIGTSSPAVAFDLYATDALRVPVGTTVQRPSVGDVGYVRYNVTTHQFEGYGDNAVWQGLGGVINAAQTSYITAGTDDFLRFFTTSGERMTITNTGNIGIGTTTPWGQLSVNPNGITGPSFVIGSSTATNFIVTNGGNVGIGTSSPAFKLDVNGIVNATALYVNGTPYIGSQWTTSGSSIYYTTGNIGIGTTTPFAALHVATTTGKNLVLSDSGAGTNLKHWLFSSLGGSLFIGTTTDAYATSSPPAFTITNTGNVGIGVVSPTEKLEVNGAIHIYSATPVSSSMALYNNAGTLTWNGVALATGGSSISGTTNYIPIFTGAATLGNSALYQSGSNVGIGMTGPVNKLEVAGDIGIGTAADVNRIIGRVGLYSSGLRTLTIRAGSTSDNTSATGGAYITLTNALNGGGAYGEIIYNTNSGGGGLGDHRFQTAGTARMIILESSGNVGIGTTNPGAKLEVNGAIMSKASGAYFIAQDTAAYSAGANGAALYLQGLDSTSVNNNLGIIQSVAMAGQVSDLIFKTANTGSTQVDMRIQGSTGSVGVTTLAAGTANSLCYNTTAITGMNTLSTCSSDQRLKQNIASLDGTAALAQVMQLNPVSFNWNPSFDTSGKEQFGLIAQQVEHVWPNLVSTTSPTALTPDGTLSLNFNGLYAPIIASIQELNKRTSFIQNAATSTVLTVDVAGNVGIGTTIPNHTLTVAGDVGAIAFVNTSTRDAKTDISYVSASSAETMLDQLVNLKVATYRYKIEDSNDSLRLGFIAEEAQSVAPEVLSADGKGVDLYKLATFTLAGVQALAAKVDAHETRLTSLESRIAALESGAISSASGSPLSLSTTSLASAFEGLGVLIKKGIAQFNTLVFRQLVASKDADGTSSAGSVIIPVGSALAQVSNSLVLPSTKIFVTFNASVAGSWWVADKTTGSFRVVLSAPQTADVSFDYFLVQTEGQMATSTPNGVGGVAQSSGPDTTPPVITMLGANPMHLSIGGTFTEPGVSALDAVDGTITIVTFINGIQQEASSATIDTSAQITYIITYSATDAAGNSATATRSVIVGSTPPSADTTAPVVTLIGSAALELTVGDTFTDLGATALDDVDGDLTSSIVEIGSATTTTLGTFNLTYTATDTAGNIGSVSRLVTVASSTQPI